MQERDLSLQNVVFLLRGEDLDAAEADYAGIFHNMPERRNDVQTRP